MMNVDKYLVLANKLYICPKYYKYLFHSDRNIYDNNIMWEN